MRHKFVAVCSLILELLYKYGFSPTLVTNTSQWLTHLPPLTSLQITHEITSVRVTMPLEGRVLILICHILGSIPSATQQIYQTLQILRAALYFGGWNKHHRTGKSWIWNSGPIPWMVVPLEQHDLHQSWICFLQCWVITRPVCKHSPWRLIIHDAAWPNEKFSWQGFGPGKWMALYVGAAMLGLAKQISFISKCPGGKMPSFRVQRTGKMRRTSPFLNLIGPHWLKAAKYGKCLHWTVLELNIWEKCSSSI